MGRLNDLYGQEGIAVSDFHCPHVGECAAAAAPRPLTHGAEAHVGSRYGEATRLVVLSLDTGGGSHTIEDRTAIIESLADPAAKPNPHMKGTLAVADAILRPEIGDRPSVHFFAMTNAAKCSASDSRADSVPRALYRNCRGFAEAELVALEPEVIVAQGARARPVLQTKRGVPKAWLDEVLKPMPTSPPIGDWLVGLSGRFLRLATIGGGEVLLIQTPHPSDRGGRWKLFEPGLPALGWLVRQVVALAEYR